MSSVPFGQDPLSMFAAQDEDEGVTLSPGEDPLSMFAAVKIEDDNDYGSSSSKKVASSSSNYNINISEPDCPECGNVCSNYHAYLDQIKLFYGQEKTMMAYKMVTKLEQSIELHKNSNKHEVGEVAVEVGLPARSQEAHDFHAKVLADIPENKDRFLLERIKSEAQAVSEAINQIKDDKGWELCRDDMDVKTYFKQTPDSPTYLIKVVGIVESPAFEVLACVNEIDLYKTWIPTVVESNIALSISDYKKIVHLKFDPPSPINWVISNRDMVLYGYGVDIMEDNKLLAMARSATPADEEKLRQENSADFVLPPATPDRIRMDCWLAGLLFEPIDKNRTSVAVMSNVDPKIQLPYWIINTATKSLAHMMFVYLRTQVQNLKTAANGEYERRLNLNGGLYDNIRQRLEGNFGASPTIEDN